MTEARKDGNMVPTLLGTLNTDGETPTLIAADPTSHGLEIEDNTTGSDLSDDIASRDNNGEPVLMAVSSSDGITPVAVYANASNQILIDSS